MSGRTALIAAALLAFLAVALGAFGAHALKTRVAPDLQSVWQTAVQYHGWHALALLFRDRALLNRIYGPQSLEEEISMEIGHAEAREGINKASRT